ncbi:Enkurin domain-containing protein 1 [Chamberlinius hualienensis]
MRTKIITNMPPLLYRSASSDLISKKTGNNAYETLAGILMEIENKSLPVRTKPKPEKKNFGQINVARIREIQRLCRLANESNKTSLPIKIQHAPQSNLYRDVPSRLSEYTRIASGSRSKLSSACDTLKDVKMSRTPEYSRSVSKLNIPATSNTGRIRSVQSLKSQSGVAPTGNQNPGLPQINLANTAARTLGQDKANVQSYKSTNVASQKQTNTNLDLDLLMQSKRSDSNLKSQNNNLKCGLSLPANYKLGTVPLYLQKRQRQWLQDEERQKLVIREASIPPGHELLPEEERTKTLEKLQNNYDDVLKQMSQLPIRMDTFRLQQQKETLEIRLVKIEEAIKIFSRPKVFIKKTT